MNDRAISEKPGAYFSRGEAGEVLFSYVMDASSRIGPRPATAADQADHAEAWRAFREAEGLGGLDLDARGGAGGSLPRPEVGTSRRRKVTNEPSHDHPEGR